MRVIEWAENFPADKFIKYGDNFTQLKQYVPKL